MDEQQSIERAIGVIRRSISSVEMNIEKGYYSPDGIEKAQLDLVSLRALLEFTERKLNPPFRERMRETWLDLVVVFDYAAVNLIYRYLLFYMAIGAVLLVILAYKMLVN